MEISKKTRNLVARYDLMVTSFDGETISPESSIKQYKRNYRAQEEADKLTLKDGSEYTRYFVKEVFVEVNEEPRPNNYVHIEEVVAKADTCGAIRETYWTEQMSLVHVMVTGKAKPHTHDTEEVYFILKGEGYLTIDGRKDYVEMGDTIGIPKGKEHFIEGNLELIVTNTPGFNPEQLRF